MSMELLITPEDREELGKIVRRAWVQWAKEQPAPKPSWLVPWTELNEADKEADRRIGEAVAGYVVRDMIPDRYATYAEAWSAGVEHAERQKQERVRELEAEVERLSDVYQKQVEHTDFVRAEYQNRLDNARRAYDALREAHEPMAADFIMCQAENGQLRRELEAARADLWEAAIIASSEAIVNPTDQWQRGYRSAAVAISEKIRELYNREKVEEEAGEKQKG